MPVGALLSDLWSARHGMVAGAVAGAALALALSQMATPSFDATAQILIDPQNLQLLERDLSPTTASGDAGVVLIESQARVMGSEAVLRAAAEALDLAHDPEFVGRGNLLKAWLDTLSASDAPADDLGRAVLALGKAVHVVRLDRTYVVDIHASSESAGKAAAIANAVVDAYLALRERQRAEQAGRASTALAGRLAQLLAELEAAENAVERFKADNAIIETGGQLLLEGEVDEASQAMRDADKSVAALTIQLAQLRQLAADPARLSATPEMQASPNMARLRDALEAAQGEVAALGTTLGIRHPTFLAAQQRAISAQAAIEAELTRSITATELALERATTQAQTLTDRFSGSAGDLQRADELRIRLRQLQREAEASRAIYEDALLRSRETAEQAQIDTLNAQIVSRASPPVERSFPPRPLVLVILGILCGSAAGGALAWWRRRRRQP